MTHLKSLKTLFYPALIASCLGLYTSAHAASAGACPESAQEEVSATRMKVWGQKIDATEASLKEASADARTQALAALTENLKKEFVLEEPLLTQLKSANLPEQEEALKRLRTSLPTLDLLETEKLVEPTRELSISSEESSLIPTQPLAEGESSEEEAPEDSGDGSTAEETN